MGNNIWIFHKEADSRMDNNDNIVHSTCNIDFSNERVFSRYNVYAEDVFVNS